MTLPDETGTAPATSTSGSIVKSPTGIPGFDEITRGGLPHGRVTLVLGGPGTGKTVFALEALVNGARERQEPGIFVAFEENARQVVANAATFGWDLEALEREQLFFLDARLSPTVVQSGAFDISSLLASLEAKAGEMGARTIVFDGIDVLLTLLDDAAVERREVYRLYEWLQRHGVTGIITAKADESDRPTTERYAFMQFMVDCVVLLQQRLTDRVATRSVRVLKYRGSGFDENEFPLVITDAGLEVSTFGLGELDHPAFDERVSTGVPRLDDMLGGGYYRGSSTLITGAPGTAKTTLAGAFAAAACARGERALYVSFDEGAEQLARNLTSVHVDLRPYVDAERLLVYSVRTESRAAEQHLLDIKRRISALRPSVLVLDPISALTKAGAQVAALHAAFRLLDYARTLGITVLCTSLTASEAGAAEATNIEISTLADTWIHLAYLVRGGERNRTLTIVKSRGTRHSNQVRELLLGDDGVSLADVYTAGGEVLVGTARWEREAEVREAEQRRLLEAEHRRREAEHAEAELAARIGALQRELEARQTERERLERDELARRDRRASSQEALSRLRWADARPAAVMPADAVPAARGGGGDR